MGIQPSARWAAAGAAVLLSVLTAACSAAPESPAKAPSVGAPAPEIPAPRSPHEMPVKPIPNYRAPELTARDVYTRKPLILSSFKGQVVMVNFWATWCGPCREEMPEMEKFHQELGDKVKIIALGVDPGEEPEQLAAFASELGLTFPIAWDEGQGAMNYRANGIPTTVWIDREGVIRYRHAGPMTLAQMKKYADNLIRPDQQ